MNKTDVEAPRLFSPEQLKCSRLLAHLTREEVARLVAEIVGVKSISVITVGRWERGENRPCPALEQALVKVFPNIAKVGGDL